MNSQQICLLLRSLYKSMDLHEITACFLLIYWEDLGVFLEFPGISPFQQRSLLPGFIKNHGIS